MEGFFKGIESINSAVNGVVWGVPMLILIIGTGIYLSVRTGFFQLTGLKHWLGSTLFAIFRNKSVTKSGEKKAISQFQALTTALAASIGTGNIAGVATAIAAGGPGAVFWMWVSAFFGMMTSFTENVLGIYYRRKNSKGEWSGGAMYYLENGVGAKNGMKLFGRILAVLFAVFCVLASFGIGNMTQANSISAALESDFGVSPLLTGLIIAFISALVIMGGIKRIGAVTEKLVPFMALFYMAGCLIIFFMNYGNIPYVFGSIFSSAFDFRAVSGGAGGYIISRAVTMGFKRGVFSNEAGLGSSVLVNCASDVREPVKQGMWGIFQVFFDTIVMCTLTAFVLLSSPAKAATMEEAFGSISTEPCYFTLSESEQDRLIDGECGLIPVITDSDRERNGYRELPGKTIYGQELTLRLREGKGEREEDFTFSNMMKLTGIQGENADGTPMTDEKGNPVITAVRLEELNGVPLVTYAFSMRFGDISGKIIAVAVVFFAFSTLIGWSYYGAKALEYLFGARSAVVYKGIFVCFIVIGCAMDLRLVWGISDTLNALMAVPNLIGVLLLSGTAVKITRNYNERRKGKRIKPLTSAYNDEKAP